MKVPRETKGRRRDFGSIASNGTPTSPSFTVRWFEGGKKRRKRGFTSRTAAQEFLARTRAGLVDGVAETRRRAETPFSAAGGDWLKLHSKPNCRDHKTNEERWENHAKPFFGDLPLSAITPTRILEFRAKLKGAGKLSGQTINRCLQLVRQVLKFAVMQGNLPVSPTDKIPRGKLMLPVVRKKLEPPIEKPEDVGRLLETIRTQHPERYALFATLIYTGVRKGEACGLRWSDVDLDRRIITIRRSYGDAPKSGKERQVPIPPELVSILAQHRLSDPHKGPLAFPNDDGSMFTPDAKFQTVLKEALEACGLKPMRVHDCRHLYASHFMMAGGNLFDLQKILGHSTPQLTADTYAHLAASHLVEQSTRVSFPRPKTASVVPMINNSGDEPKRDSAEAAAR